MEFFFYFCLFIFGTLFGSFSSVLLYRLKSGESGILNGRSHCPKCNHILGSLELIPIFSWIKNFGKCKYCKEKVSSIYPILELSTGILFSLIGYFLIDFTLISSLNISEISKLIFWLSIGFITILYTFYDILFLEIHEGIMLSGIVISLIYLITETFLNQTLLIIITSVILSIIIIGLLYIIMIKELKEIWDVLIIIGIIGVLFLYKILFHIELTQIEILNSIIGALIFFIFFFIQIIISKGAWMGGGDLRIAILVGLLLGYNFAFSGLMLTYLVGSIIGIFFIIINRLKNKGAKFNTQIPFGPFLAIGFFITIFYSTQINNIINIYF